MKHFEIDILAREFILVAGQMAISTQQQATREASR